MIAIANDQWLQYTRASSSTRPSGQGWETAVHDRAATISASAQEPRLIGSHAQLDRLALLADDWDGNGSSRPNSLAIARARQFLEDSFYGTKAVGWLDPFISASEDGEVVFEWWNGQRKLTIYIGPALTTFLKSWGPNIVADMEDGSLACSWDPVLWAWLIE